MRYAAVTPVGRRAMDAIAASPGDVLLALDFDGTLAQIVDDPATARPLPEAIDALVRSAGVLGHVALITGREVQDAVRLGDFDQIEGLERLIVLGQYGSERWDAATGYQIPPVPEAVGEMVAELPGVLAAAGYPRARLEHKRRSVAVHTREQANPQEAYDALGGPLTELAHRHGLEISHGRYLWDIRSGQCDKGRALRRLADELRPRVVVFFGDDLDDEPAFEALDGLRGSGIAGIGVWSASEEVPELAELADVVCDGPEGVCDWLNSLAAMIEHTPRP